MQISVHNRVVGNYDYSNNNDIIPLLQNYDKVSHESLQF